MSAHGGLQLFLGPDRAQKLQRIQALERSLLVQPLDRHHVDATQTAGSALLGLCRQRPAASPLRLIVVDQAHRLDAATVEALVQHAPVIAHSACVILLVETELSARHALVRGAEALTTERFVGREAPATKPFALTDALGNRDAAGALGAVHDQLLAGKEPLELLGLVVWQVNRWALVRRLLDERCGAERMAAVTGLRPWQLQRMQSEVRGRSLPSLQRLLSRCWRLDVDAKTGRASPAFAIEQVVLEVCAQE